MSYIKKKKNIGFISTRFQGTDGVTLETEKWVKVLEKMGYNCFFYAGLSNWPKERTMVQAEAFFDHPEIRKIQKACFDCSKRSAPIAKKIHSYRTLLKESLFKFIKKFKIDILIIENANSIPMNIPFGLAITELIAETALPTIGHHHDFHWERDRFMINCVNDYIKMAFPPSLPSIHHVVINSEAAHQLSYRRGLTSTVIPNVFDYKKAAPKSDTFTKNIRSDLGLAKDDILFLQPTRIVPRKGIEHSIELVSRLKNSKIKIVIAHMEKDEGKLYLTRIKEYAKHMKVPLIIRPDLISCKRTTLPNGKKQYDLWDFYPPADFICYPSLYEGFGNAFLEAVYFKKPILVNRYAIYRRDIEPQGFKVVTMDNFITEEVVKEVRNILEKPKSIEEELNRNFSLASQYYSYEVLEHKLKSILVSF